jgi:hypothetical protein
MGANPFQGPLKVVGPENCDFWALKWQRDKPINIQLQKCLFYMVFGLDDYDGGKSITRAIERGGS